MLLVGLTGGLGAGKSTVGRMLADRGAVVVDADDLAREAIAPGTHGHHEVVQVFGDEVVAPDGSIDRAALSRIVFADPAKRRALESITHPEVFRLLAAEAELLRGTDGVLVFDAPLIVETGFHEACDVVVVVTASVERQVERVARDRGMDADQARARIAAQVPPERREAVADVVVRNDGDLRALEEQVDDLWERLRREARGGRVSGG
ncbi:MAG TPA: dephospho-CoA kinase [Actinomycetota bacterium]|nr:dephospho-CoA kinase [Actinomycetota bacterium]